MGPAVELDLHVVQHPMLPVGGSLLGHQLRAWQGGGGGGEARLWVWQSRARTQQQNVALLDAMSSLEIRHTANVWHHHKLVGRGVQAYAPK